MTSFDSGQGLNITADRSPRLFTQTSGMSLIPAQIARFTRTSLRAVKTRDFDPRATLQTLNAAAEAHVIAVDIGGDKLIASRYAITKGVLRRVGAGKIRERTAGAGYLDALEEAAAQARADGLPVGVSYAGPIEGTKVLAGMNVPVFMRDLQSRYGGDFAKVYSPITLANDAEAGTIAASVEAVRRYPASRNVIYVINGSGIGGAVLKDNVLYATETGHVQIQDSLNRFRQRTPCGMFGAEYVCLERVAASKSGIEDMWRQRRGQQLTGKEIAAAYLAGDEFACGLYETSVLVVVHIVMGIASAFGLLNEWDETVVVGHGGTFNVPGYSESVRLMLAREVSARTRMLFTKDFSLNTCLDGAAIAAARSIP